MNATKRARLVFSVAALIAVLVLVGVAPALAVQVGNDEVNYMGVTYDYPAVGQSTWYYEVISGGQPAISHLTFELNLDCVEVLEAGTWDGVDKTALTPGGGDPVIGTDPTTGVTGIKFDQGFIEGETRYYYFTVNGNYAEDNTVVVASKGGDSFDSATITGPSKVCKDREPCLDADVNLVKKTNGDDANEAPGPDVVIGAPVTWTFEVTNTGSDPLVNVRVYDRRYLPTTGNVVIVCTIAEIAPGDTVTCERTGVAEPGQYKNLGKADGYCGTIRVRDGDYSHYFGVEQLPQP
jgi:hypothetical protein